MNTRDNKGLFTKEKLSSVMIVIAVLLFTVVTFSFEGFVRAAFNEGESLTKENITSSVTKDSIAFRKAQDEEIFAQKMIGAQRELDTAKEDKMAAISPKYIEHYNDENLYLVARIIASEESSQQEEDLSKKVAVGLVVLNRTVSKGFPNTVEGVIFQKNQFQPTFDGSWERKPPTEFDYLAAQKAFESEEVGVNEALFFLDPTISDSDNVAWFRDKLTYVGTLGAHDFYK